MWAEVWGRGMGDIGGNTHPPFALSAPPDGNTSDEEHFDIGSENSR